MMFSSALAILTLCFLVTQSVQGGCVPRNVVNLKVIADHFLVWDENPEELCGIDQYLVYIFHRDQPAEYAFSVDEKRVDVSFLEICEEWTFVVVPVSGHIIGAERRVVARLPLPPDADLSLSELMMFQDENACYLSWNLTQPSLGSCLLEYRVSAKMAGSPVAEELFVEQNNAELRFLAPCSNYELTVVATNKADRSIMGPPISVDVLTGRRIQGPPQLVNAEIGTNEVNMTFMLESEVRNPCALRSLYIDGGSAINQSVDLEDQDRSLPVNVTISNLMPDSLYFMKIYVNSVAGWSNASQISVQTLNVESGTETWRK